MCTAKKQKKMTKKHKPKTVCAIHTSVLKLDILVVASQKQMHIQSYCVNAQLQSQQHAHRQRISRIRIKAVLSFIIIIIVIIFGRSFSTHKKACMCSNSNSSSYRTRALPSNPTYDFTSFIRLMATV